MLIVDDAADARSLYGEYLEFCGFRVISAIDTLQGTSMAQLHMPDIILMDLALPLMNGWDVLAALAAEARIKDIPVILVTVLDETQIAFAVDGITYVHKPFSKKDITEAIHRGVLDAAFSPTFGTAQVSGFP